MGLPPGESPALTQIESELAKSDPSLAVMLAVFAADPARARECSRPAAPRHSRAKRAAVLAVLAALLILALTLAGLTAH